jgi:serine/threonine-protein kinase
LLLALPDEGTRVAAGELASYGRCEVIRRLGGGPRDEVLLARSAGPGGFRRKVVLERRLVGGDDPRPLERLAREAHAYALLTHPAIARLFDFLLLDGHPVIVREYVSGVPLAELMTALGERDGEARASIALYVVHCVLSALAAAHDASEPDTGDLVPLVHGDVRAGCVLVAWNGDVKLVGFAGAREEHGRPLTMKSDVRAAALLLVDLLGPRGALDPSSEADLRGAVARLPLQPVRAEHRADLRDALIAALLLGAAVPPRAHELAAVIAEAIDLHRARALCLDILGELHESQGGPSPSSLPPPAVAVEGDSGFFQRLQVPKPSPVPNVPSDPPPAPAEAYETPPPVQPPSWRCRAASRRSTARGRRAERRARR